MTLYHFLVWQYEWCDFSMLFLRVHLMQVYPLSSNSNRAEEAAVQQVI